jgi:peptidoglycan/LPS O-acetylase OafA/YrhL
MLFGCFMLFNLFNDAIIKHPKVAALVLFVVYILPIPANIPFYVPTIMHYTIFFCAGYIIGYEMITPRRERCDMRNTQVRARGLSKFKCLASNKIPICLSLLLIILFPLLKLQLALIPALLGIHVIYGFSVILTRTSIIQNKIFEIILRDNFGLYLWHPMIIYLLFYLGSGARVRGQSLTKYGRYPIHKEGKIRYSAQHRAKAFDF